MKLLIRMETLRDPFIINIGRKLEEEINLNKELLNISFPEIEGGFIVILRVYPKADFEYPAYATGVRMFKRKDKILLVSSNIEMESLIGLNQIEIYNLFLRRVISSLSILEEKKIKGADIEYLSSVLDGFFNRTYLE